MTQAPVVLSPYDPDWPRQFEAERALLMSLIGECLHGDIRHIGSTAVPGLIAKPVIDVMFGVRSLEESRPAIAVLTANGYQYFPYRDDVMHWFCKPSDAFRTHHIHLVPYRSELWNERLRFRDLLRSNARVAQDYAQLKQDLAARFRDDRETYTEAKWPFIQQALGLE